MRALNCKPALLRPSTSCRAEVVRLLKTYSPEDPSPQHRDLFRRIQLAISRVSCDLNVPAAQTVALRSKGVSISVSGLATTAAMDLAQNGASFSTLIALASVLPSGAATLSRGTVVADSYILSSGAQIPLAFRSQLIAIKGTQAECDDLFPYAFPRLYFHTAFSLFDLGVPENEALNTGLRHLSWLNDDFMNVFEQSNRQLPEVVRRASIAISDESPLTKGNRKAMKEREIEVEGTTICCTLHSKLRQPLVGYIFISEYRGAPGAKLSLEFLLSIY